MILRQIKDYLREKGSAELPEIMTVTETDKNTAEHVLELLSSKGIVKKEVLKPSCKGCTCSGICISETVIYHYSKK
ncbi:MAG: hypothetical protein JW982_11705 [Spirochaetes bacterium]|nr:hypothetical protein [Spirochaetota bacterium]